MRKLGHIAGKGLLILGLAAIAVTPAIAESHQRHNDHDRDDYGNRHYNRHYYNNRPYYNRPYRYGGGYYYRGRHRDHGGEVALGVLTGGLLFYALTANNRTHYNNNRTIYVREKPVYIQPPAQPRNQYASSSCLQVREYQTTITVGGQNVPAYGQSCLQPDGTWKLGPAIPEPGN